MAPQQNVVSPEDMLTKDSVWIFGYGSLIWHPNFDFTERKVGYVSGFVTRFWQASVAHRGTADKPGRVATMVEQSGGRAWGVAFKVEGTDQITKAFLHLNMRECLLGGYEVQQLTFEVVGGADEEAAVIPALAFRATPENELFVGPDSVEAAAEVVASSRGRTGHNAEYLFRLVDFMRRTAPNARDRYLFQLGALTRKLLNCRCDSDGHSHRSIPRVRTVSGIADKAQYYHKCYVAPSPVEGKVL